MANGQLVADTALFQYVQRQEALYAIDRASLADSDLEDIASLAVDGLTRLVPSARVTLTVSDRLFGSLVKHHAGNAADTDFSVLAQAGAGSRPGTPDAASVLKDGPSAVSQYALYMPLTVQGDLLGKLMVEPSNSVPFSSSEIETAREFADRMERALHHALIRDKLQRYTLELEHAVAVRTREVERRRQAAEGLRELLGYLITSRPLGEIFNQIFKQAELLLGADAIAVFSPVDATAPEIGPENQIFAHTSFSNEIGIRNYVAAREAVRDAVRDGKSVIVISPGDQSNGYRAQLAVPMRAELDLFGVVVYFFADQTDLDPECLDLAVSLGEQVVLATESDRLQQRAQDAALLEERERLARELHDAVMQSIYSLTLFAEAGRRVASVGQLDRVQDYLVTLSDTAQQALKQMRLMLFELRPARLEQVGLVEALRQRLEAVEQRAGIQTRLEVIDSLRLPPAVAQSLYRICQEALNNALKHASASEVLVRLAVEGDVVTLDVLDNGIGFVLDDARTSPGLGLAYIRERAEHLNAELTIDTEPDHGTHVRVALVVPQLTAAMAKTDIATSN